MNQKEERSDVQLNFGIGYGVQTVEIEEKHLLGILEPNPTPYGLTGEAAVLDALEHPIDSPRLSQIVRPGEKVTIVTSDITRPMPTAKVMPALLDEIYRGGVHPKDITLVFALGSHRRQSEEE